ncbi:hypothetical protein FGO68_gene13444 [Halteria grandinella]|uniref:Uncharacterized protein n=1 Tax=Halteria grandinella TaxID=5974 RepID=A0A8J8T9H7_HALGN|nr:hypothetical protein FGO68_gene13444 [Halteria grandinella]
MILSITFMVLLQLGRPFPEIADVRLATLNELLISLYLYSLMCLTDYNEEGAFRLELGLGLLFLVVFCVAVNVIYVFGNLLAMGLRKLYLKCLRCKARYSSAQKYQLNEQHEEKSNSPSIKEQVKLETIQEEVEEKLEQTHGKLPQLRLQFSNDQQQPYDSSTNLLNDMSTMRQANSTSINIEEQEIEQFSEYRFSYLKRRPIEQGSPSPFIAMMQNPNEAEATQNLNGKLKLMIEPTTFSVNRTVNYSQKKREEKRRPFI